MRARKTRPVPWLLLIEGAVAVKDHWENLSPGERQRVAKLLRKSGGRPSNLSAREKAELKRLGRKLDPAGLGKKLLPIGRSAQKKRRR